MEKEQERDKHITVLMASVVERETQLKIVLKRIYDKVCHIVLVLNYYEEIPEWIANKPKIFPVLNQCNKNAHDSVWSYVPDNGYIFIMDDDLLYSDNFFDKLIAAIERHERRAVITAHGSNIQLPAADYIDCRVTYGFSDARERDIFNDLAGVGCTAFHANTFWGSSDAKPWEVQSSHPPTLQDFPIPFCRDLYFSIFCAKHQIKIVNIERPSSWILPLKTSGDSVYQATKNNKQLRDVKNRVLKEQLLPLLHCENHDGTGQYVLVTDYDFDERLMDASLSTLNQVNPDCNIVVFTDELKDYSFVTNDSAIQKRSVLTQYVTEGERAIGRMGSKVLTQYRFICGLPNGSKVISADADLYYLKDPFEAFEWVHPLRGPQNNFDIGPTTRHYRYQHIINGGVVMFNVNDRVKDFLRFLIGQIYDRTWPELIEYQKRFSHSGNDWYFDQDVWCTAFLNQFSIERRFDVKIRPIAPSFNYCPHADGSPEAIGRGKDELLKAYHNNSVHVLHLKSRLKELLLDGELE